MFITEFIQQMDTYAKNVKLADTSRIDAYDFKEYMTQLTLDGDPYLYGLLQKWKGDETIYIGKYVRVPIHRTDTLELIMIIWYPGSTTPVHSHPRYGCLFRVLDGTIHAQTYMDDDMSSIYKVTSDHILPSGSIDYTKGQHGIHRVFNPYNTVALSLHLYIHREPIYTSRVGNGVSIP
jgi:hypothetical protein